MYSIGSQMCRMNTLSTSHNIISLSFYISTEFLHCVFVVNNDRFYSIVLTLCEPLHNGFSLKKTYQNMESFAFRSTACTVFHTIFSWSYKSCSHWVNAFFMSLLFVFINLFSFFFFADCFSIMFNPRLMTFSHSQCKRSFENRWYGFIFFSHLKERWQIPITIH